MSQTLIVKKGKGVCPYCNKHLNVISKINGEGSRPFGNSILRKLTNGIKIEIICAYLDDPSRLYTTKEIIARINLHRNPDEKKIERSNLTRPHSELVDAGVIQMHHKEGWHYYYRLNVEKAKACL